MSANLNVWTFNGRLVKEPESRYTPDGTAVTNMRVAVNNFSDKAIFMDVVAWGKLAESTNEYLVKGQEVTVSGRLEEEQWEGDDGKRRSRMFVTANFIEFGRRPKGKDDDGHTGPAKKTKSSEPVTSPPMDQADSQTSKFPF